VFAHARVGRGGRPFRCYKFRTMVPNAAEALAELLARDPAARARCLVTILTLRVVGMGGVVHDPTRNSPGEVLASYSVTLRPRDE